MYQYFREFKRWLPLFLALLPAYAEAHPAFYHAAFQTYRLTVSVDELSIEYLFSYGLEKGDEEFKKLDIDGDKIASPEERKRYMEAVNETLMAQTLLGINGKRTRLEISEEPILGQAYLYFHWKTPLSTSEYKYIDIQFVNANPLELEPPASILVNFAPGVQLLSREGLIPQATPSGGSREFPSDRIRFVVEIIEGAQCESIRTYLWPAPYAPQVESQEAPLTTAKDSEMTEKKVPSFISRMDTKLNRWITERMQNPETRWTFIFSGLLVAGILGGLHALTPGHGKTIVAAYLVGTKGRMIDAVFLGIVVTITHTASVLVLGLGALFLSKWIVPEVITPWLSLISGLLIVILALVMLIQRIRHFGKLHDHDHPHSHTHPHQQHHHHAPKPDDKVTWGGLLSLGISGGLVPCPEALALLLMAVALQKIMLGLGLLVSFSFGLAIVLIIVGLVMVLAKQRFETVSSGGRITRTLPMVSATILLILGISLTYAALLEVLHL